MAKSIPDPPNFHALGTMEAFVLAASTPTVQAACDVLFVAPSDLVWDAPAFGHLLVDGPVDQSLREALELAAAASEFEFGKILKAMWPELKPILGSIVAEATRRGRGKKGAEANAMAAISNVVALGLMGHSDGPTSSAFAALIPVFATLLPKGASWSAARLAIGAMALRERQLASTGFSAERYAAMVKAMSKIGVVQPLFRVIRPPGNSAAEITLASTSGLLGSAPTAGSRTLEICRLDPAFSQLRAGEDRALALFIADFINHGMLVDPPAAFPCAKYGEKNAAEFDVVVPEARVGFEIKLFQGSNAKVVENLAATSKKLAEKQIPAYRELGCKKVVLVTNLDEGRAQALLVEIRRANPKLRGYPITVVSSHDRLVNELRDLVRGISAPRSRALDKEVKGLAKQASRKAKRKKAEPLIPRSATTLPTQKGAEA